MLQDIPPTIPDQDPLITEDARLVRTTSLSIDSAVYKYMTFNQREPDQWQIGITSDTVIMLDIDKLIPEEDVIRFADRLRDFITKGMGIQNRVLVIRTTKGYHIVSDADLLHKQWMIIYDSIMCQIKKKDITLPPLDEMHIELSLKYEKTTLRISPKHGDKEVYMPIYMSGFKIPSPYDSR